MWYRHLQCILQGTFVVLVNLKNTDYVITNTIKSHNYYLCMFLNFTNFRSIVLIYLLSFKYHSPCFNDSIQSANINRTNYYSAVSG